MRGLKARGRGRKQERRSRAGKPAQEGRRARAHAWCINHDTRDPPFTRGVSSTDGVARVEIEHGEQAGFASDARDCSSSRCYQARGEPVVLHLLGGGCFSAADSSRQIA